MVRLSDGDRSAFTPAFRLLWPKVRAVCVAILKHSQDADDAAQETMEKILTRASDYDRSRPALPWALAIAAWECRTIQTRRQRRKEVATDVLPDLPAEGASDQDYIRLELVNAVRDVMAELSASDRETLVSTYWEESQQAAAPALRKRRQRAVERLRVAFRRLYGTD